MNPLEYTFTTWPDCLKVKFYCFAVVTKIECTSYLVMLVVGKMGMLHFAVFSANKVLLSNVLVQDQLLCDLL